MPPCDSVCLKQVRLRCGAVNHGMCVAANQSGRSWEVGVGVAFDKRGGACSQPLLSSGLDEIGQRAVDSSDRFFDVALRMHGRDVESTVGE